MSVYSTPPEDARDLLDFLADCVSERMEREHENWENEDMPEDDDQLVIADTAFASKEGIGMFVGPFRNGDKIWSFVVKIDGINKIE